jgi:ATP-dependent RNA helicase RhlB
VNTRSEADRLSDALQRNGIEAEALSGDVPQRKRLRMLKDFQAGKLAVLIGTDVASRGLHVPGVSHVFNYDLPQDPEDYVHRIGRTARAGAAGDAISFGCETYAISLPEIEAFIGRKIPVASFDHNALVPFTAPEPRHRHAHGGDGPRHHRPQGGGGHRGAGGGGHRGGGGGGGGGHRGAGGGGRRDGRGRRGGGPSSSGAPPG